MDSPLSRRDIIDGWAAYLCGCFSGCMITLLLVFPWNAVTAPPQRLGVVRSPQVVHIHMPDPEMTPGVVDASFKEGDICKKGWASQHRNVSQKTKELVYARYGIKSHRPGEFEIDHLCSIELGGKNEIENLWPQPYEGEWNAHMKDRLENKLHQLVCSGAITLEEAQQEIIGDWVEAYQKYISN